jgi:triosephosphate isomerase
MRQPLVVGNWKMNGSRKDNTALLAGLKAGISNIKKTVVSVCPPFVYLSEVASLLAGTPISWGSQNISDQVSGAYTGEISGSMLKDLGCTYAIVGHSERRSIYKESDEDVAKKFAAARKVGLIPILCVGELLEEREKGITEQVVGRQLDAVIALEGVAALADAVIAYEPVWAIGTGKTASPEQAQEVHAFIRSKIASLDKNVGDKVQILYGGSVKGSNAKELFSQPDIDGGLIGGASLLVDDFLNICSAGDQ